MANNMYNEFKIIKSSGTYAETLEAFGVANLIQEILARSEIVGSRISIEDKGLFYAVCSNKDISEEMINSLPYFQIIKFIIKDNNNPVPERISSYFDYPAKKALKDKNKKNYDDIGKNSSLSANEKKEARKKLGREIENEFGLSIDSEYSVYSEIIKNPYPSFLKLFNNLHNNQTDFTILVTNILRKYTEHRPMDLTTNNFEKSPTCQQLFNPNQGKGLNENKANSLKMGNQNSDWISETMKISGALTIMSCQFVKVGSAYDMKIFVPEFKNISLSEAKSIILDFKKHLKSYSPVKLDIINILSFTIKFIRITTVYRDKVKNTIQGFHTVYQKDLGQNKAVANISFIHTPDFVEFSNKEESIEWIEILEHQKELILQIEELGDAAQGLQAYRIFLSSVGHNALTSFLDFSFWYAGYLMQALAKNNRFLKPFNTQILNKYYQFMQSNLSEIIQNDGFKAVSKAIRKSTVSLQYTPKSSRRYEIRYGLAQKLQNKSKSKVDLSTFIGEFIATYNTETSRSAEKNGGKTIRSNVKDSELNSFYEILDTNPSRLVGALLASYGFALEKNEIASEEELKKLEDQAAKLGYTLVLAQAKTESSESEGQSDNNYLETE